MSWTTDFKNALSDELTPAAARLLDAILNNLAEDKSDPNLWSATKEQVLKELENQEQKSLDLAAIRQRIQTIRNAITAVDEYKINNKPALAIKSEKYAFTITWQEGAKDQLQRSKTRMTIVESGHADRQTEIGPIPTIDADFQIETVHYVFLSHNWEIDEQNKILDDFAKILELKLSKLPARWADKFTVKLLHDLGKEFHSKASFTDQMNELCSKSSFAIFMMSDGWCLSKACQLEAAHFKSRDKQNGQHPYSCIQFIGNFSDLPDEYKAYPNLPKLKQRQFPNCENLLEIWDQSESLKDKFVSTVRDEICYFLEQTDPPKGPKKSPSFEPEKNYQKIREEIALHKHFEHDVSDTHRINTHMTCEEGDDEIINSDKRVSAVDTLYEWATDKKAPHRMVFLMGGFGMGKTTTVQILHEKLETAMQNEQLETAMQGNEAIPVPIYLDFRRLIPAAESGQIKEYTMAKLIHEALHSSVTDKVTGNQVINLIKNDRSLVIFDGLDEVGNKIGRDAAAHLFRRFLELIPADVQSSETSTGKADWAACKTRLLLTCRTHFFRSLREQTNLLSGSARRAPRLRDNVTQTQIQMTQIPGASTFYMAPLTKEQISKLFQNYLGKELGQQTFDLICRVHDLPGLATRPIMARFISEVAGQLVERHKQGDPINIATIYEELFLRGLERDAEKRPLLNVNDRRDILKALATHLQINKLGPQSADELEPWFDRFAKTHDGISLLFSSGERNTRDILHTELENASFLVRGNDDGFSFAHTSYYEYFLALVLAECPDSTELEALTTHPISHETLEFVQAIAVRDKKEKQLKAHWADILCSECSMPARRFAFNMLALETSGFDMPSGANLSDMKLLNLKIHGKFRWHRGNLDNTQLNHLDAREGVFEDCSFEGTNLANARFQNVQFKSCKGTPIGISSARGVDTTLPSKWQKKSGKWKKYWQDKQSYKSEKIILKSRMAATAFSPDGTQIITASADNKARLWDATNGQLIHTLKGHSNTLLNATFSSDGTQIITTSADQTARLWDAASGQLIHTLKGHRGTVHSAALSHDGVQIITASADTTTRLWDATTGQVTHTLEGHSSRVHSAAFSHDGAQVITASADQTVCLWDTASGQLIHTLKGHSNWVQSATFSPDGSQIITTSFDQTVRLWDTASGQLIHTLGGHRNPVWSAAFNPDGTQIITASADNKALLWDATTGQLIHTLEGHGLWVSSAAFSPDGTQIITTSFDSIARLWDATTGQVTHTLEGHNNTLLNATFSSDGTLIITTSADQTVRLWDTASRQLIHTFEGYSSPVQSAAFNPDGTQIITASADTTTRLWDATTGQVTHTLEGHSSRVHSAAFSHDGAQVITASADQTVCLWDTASGQLIHTLKGHSHWVQSATFSPDSSQIITTSFDQTVRLWDTASGQLNHTLKGNSDWVKSAAFNPDGTQIITASADNKARLWDATTGQLIYTLEGHSQEVQNAAFSPDGSQVITASADTTARLWDATTGQLIYTLEGHSLAVQSAAFNPDGTQIITASADNKARLWDATTGQLIYTLEGHSQEVQNAAFSPDGAQIITASADNTARLWDTASGRLIHTLEGHSSSVKSAAFSPDGAQIITASIDNTARLWDTASGSELMSLVNFPESWCTLSPKGQVELNGPNFWRYVA